MKQRKNKHSPKTRGAKLGQHLLTSTAIAHSMVEAGEVMKGDRVLEIGPGKGMLTEALLASGARVFAVEKDSSMVEVLKNRFATEIKKKQLVLIEGDAREYTPDKIFPQGAYKIIANIPYYITGELIRSGLTAKNKPVSIALLVQKEVAERIARSKKESILSLSVKVFGTPHYVKTVKRGSFNPPPSVDSAILAIREISSSNIKKIPEELFFQVIKCAFAQKRKTILSNLKRVFGEHAFPALDKAGIDAKTRAEDIELSKWLELAHYLKS
ncbi:ribosomal RNA small subunit methyltransferase A [Patescibacteria group bacterium]|nr:MAG: ribosomal RNA small subunit methyltransferase A [Patescibacteria group bacterium]